MRIELRKEEDEKSSLDGGLSAVNAVELYHPTLWRGAKKKLKNENSVGLGDKHITPSIKVCSDSRTNIHR